MGKFLISELASSFRGSGTVTLEYRPGKTGPALGPGIGTVMLHTRVKGAGGVSPGNPGYTIAGEVDATTYIGEAELELVNLVQGAVFYKETTAYPGTPTAPDVGKEWTGIFFGGAGPNVKVTTLVETPEGTIEIGEELTGSITVTGGQVKGQITSITGTSAVKGYYGGKFFGEHMTISQGVTQKFIVQPAGALPPIPLPKVGSCDPAQKEQIRKKVRETILDKSEPIEKDTRSKLLGAVDAVALYCTSTEFGCDIPSAGGVTPSGILVDGSTIEVNTIVLCTDPITGAIKFPAKAEAIVFHEVVHAAGGGEAEAHACHELVYEGGLALTEEEFKEKIMKLYGMTEAEAAAEAEKYISMTHCVLD